LDSWSEEEVYKRLGQAVKDEVYTMSGDPPGPSAPTYVVEAMSEIDVQYLTESILIIDFGQSFFLKSPPPDGVGTPMGYCAPEVIFDLKASAYSDIWALACTIFEIRAGQALFETFFSTQEEVIRQMVQTLGRLPGPWWHAWECRMDYFDENGKPKQEWENDIPLASLYPLIDHIKDIGEEDTNEHDVDQDSTEDAQKDGDKPDGLSRHEDKGLSATGRAKISSEVTSMEDLLSKMLKYAPEERISAEQASEHPWFTETF